MNFRRLGLGVAANAYDKLVIAGIQLLLVPVLALHWGIEVYGTWVLLSTIPSFLSASDLGFASAAGTRMTMLASRGETEEVVRVFQSAWVVVLASSAIVSIVALAAVWLLPAEFYPASTEFSLGEIRWTLSLLVVYGILCLQGSIFVAGFRCAGLFAVGAFCVANTVLFENLSVVALVVFGCGPVYAAVALLLSRCLALVVQNVVLRAKVPWLRIGFSEARRAEVRDLWGPAIALLAFPIGQASYLQGTALALGAATSAAIVPLFTATRTLSRVGLQLAQLLTHATMPEFSAAVARKDDKARVAMVGMVLITAFLIVVPFSIVLSVFGPEIVAAWTRGVIRPPQDLALVMAATVLLGGFWNPLASLIIATNRHASFAYPFLVFAVATIPLSYVASLWLGVTGAGLSILALDICMCVVTMRKGHTALFQVHELSQFFNGLKLKVGLKLNARRVKAGRHSNRM
ncbi:lipopolysaccharide biosynthesis protein [Bradyrhizobium zhanjiangense]|uniref:lipopolysaccharide biosynthesis protein n=1 Tax=Bradyrhizobium zhanjiangense TaxID=1325107 RepID=UPI001008862E|nr:lipopolysaccharide biosynthesis protein [Bradyrhizobium zhanjiangense]